MRLNVEEKVSKVIRLQSQVTGEVAEGYQVMNSVANLNRIQVTGPESAVEKINYALAEVDVSGASSNLSLNVKPKLYDVDGNLLDLPSVVMDVDYAYMSVEVLAVKEVPVVLNVTGEPAEGYLATGKVESNMETVRIAGTASALSGVNSISIPAEELDISGAEGNVVNTLNIRDYLKENIRLADSSFNGRMTVTVYVEPVADRTYVLGMNDFELINIPEGYEAELVEPDGGYQLTFSGLEEYVSAVPQGSIKGQVDLGAWLAEEALEEAEEGDYNIPITLTLPEELFREISVEREITVTVRLMKLEEI